MNTQRSSNTYTFYKYKPANIEHLMDFLDQKLWLSKIEALNDPFEGNFYLTPPTPNEILNNSQLFNDYFSFHKKNFPNATEKSYRYILNTQPEMFKHRTREVVRDIFEHSGVHCFSTVRDNILMWAYYAENHQGYCVEFKMDFTKALPKRNSTEIAQEARLLLSGQKVLPFATQHHEFAFLKVNYQDDIPTIALSKFVNQKIAGTAFETEYLLKNSIGVKYTQWSHENEYRLIANNHTKENNLLDLNIYAPFLTVSGVIIGAKTPDNKRKKIMKLCNQANVPFYTARLSKEKYSIHVE